MYGAVSVLAASDANNPLSKDIGVAAVAAFYPDCAFDTERAVPPLVLIGDKDDWTPARFCQAIADKPNMQVVVYPGATHGFAMPMDQSVEFAGHRIAYDESATKDTADRIDAFMAAHMK